MGGGLVMTSSSSAAICCQVRDDVVELSCVLRDVRQGKLTLDLRQTQGWLFEPERREMNIEAVDSES